MIIHQIIFKESSFCYICNPETTVAPEKGDKWTHKEVNCRKCLKLSREKIKVELKINTERLNEMCKDSDNYWRGYHQAEEDNSINPFTEEQVTYVSFTIVMILLGIMLWLLGKITIRSLT